ncbi:helix-turn-helix transcriptional regulator [Listeria fleischmannii]|uniref:Prophage P1 protein 11, phage transcription regulator n=1 Tax=Listeria fleischmannii FSL S10-1203 TaxID=1265822 RepID=W7DY40_9LIST|nr:helix-turn-helix transcriptional regulator [Listeria fleischmannii]EUJ53835.1 prophage P1 protein 11, phage transcription regulator [Listeria fleischmannii FSL S10-1203]
MNVNQLLKERIYELLERNNLTYNRLSTLSGVPQTTIASILNDSTVPKVDTLTMICDGFGISVQEFFDFNPYNLSKEDSSKAYLTEWNYCGNRLSPEQRHKVLEMIKTLQFPKN